MTGTDLINSGAGVVARSVRDHGSIPGGTDV